MREILLGSAAVDQTSVFVKTPVTPTKNRRQRVHLSCCPDLAAYHSAEFLPVSALEVGGLT